MSDDKLAVADSPLHTRSDWELRLVVLIAALFAAVAGGVAYAPAAAAHGGEYDIEVHNDGAGGVQVFAYYAEDGHIVEAIMDPVVEAVSSDGTEITPVRLVSSAEGQGRWIPEEPFLTDGEWTVTVSTTTPQEASTTVDMTVAIEAQNAPEASAEPAPEPESEAQPSTSPTPTPEAAPADNGQDAASGDVTDTPGLPLGVLVAIIAGVAVLAAVVAIVLGRRRSTRQPLS